MKQLVLRVSGSPFHKEEISIRFMHECNNYSAQSRDIFTNQLFTNEKKNLSEDEDDYFKKPYVINK